MTPKTKRMQAAFELLHLLHVTWDPPLYCKMSESVGSATCYCCELGGATAGSGHVSPTQRLVDKGAGRYQQQVH